MKSKLIQSAFLLFFTSFIAKLLSFFIKIYLARIMDNEAMELYTLTASTMIFLITFVQAGLPTTLNTLLAKKKNRLSIMQNALFISFFTNIIAIIIFLCIIPYITQNIHHHAQIPVLLAIIPLLPLVSMSGLCKGYCLGKQKIILATTSAITEEIVRLIFLFIAYPYVYQSPNLFASIAISSIAIGEIGTILHILLFSKSIKLTTKLFKRNLVSTLQIKEIISYAFFMSASRFIGSFTHFLEPILFTIGYNRLIKNQLISTFSYLHGYILPIITLPSFFTVALSGWLLSSLSYHLSHNQHKQAKKILTFVLSVSFLIGIFGSTICYLFANEITQLFYHTNQSAQMLKQIALPFMLFTLQTPLSTTLHAYERSQHSLWDSLLGNILRLACTLILPTMIGSNGLVIALIAGMLLTTLMHAYHIFPLLFYHP